MNSCLVPILKSPTGNYESFAEGLIYLYHNKQTCIFLIFVPCIFHTTSCLPKPLQKNLSIQSHLTLTQTITNPAVQHTAFHNLACDSFSIPHQPSLLFSDLKRMFESVGLKLKPWNLKNGSIVTCIFIFLFFC